MDRCQAEQIWALAVYSGVNAFVISESEKFVDAFAHCHLLWALGVIGFLTLVFVFERLRGYYTYRNEIARLLADEPLADAIIKKQSSLFCSTGLIWIFVFLIAVSIPYMTTAKITAQKGPIQSSQPTRCTRD